MGVAGVGKSTIGRLLASQLGWHFVDGDSYHTSANIEKMSAGIPLTDEDRVPWLAALRVAIEDWIRMHQNVVLAASALKQKYRDQLLIDPAVKLVYLRGIRDKIRARLLHRQNHFMNLALVDSQFADLEEPTNAIVVDALQAPEAIVRSISTQL